MRCFYGRTAVILAAILVILLPLPAAAEEPYPNLVSSGIAPVFRAFEEQEAKRRAAAAAAESWEFQADEGEKGRYVAHTGRAGKAAQNSLKAFELAGEAGYWAIETDIRWTADHTIICFHDESLDTHTEGSGLVEDCTWDYISTLHISAGNTETYGPQPICTFADYLDACKACGSRALIDIKFCSLGYEKMLEQAFQMVCDRGMQDDVIWQCSLGDYLTYIRSLDPDAHCWLLCGDNIAKNLSLITHAKEDLGCEGINVPRGSKKIAQAAHEQQLICVFYQTDKKSKQEKLFKRGFDLVMENGIN